MKKLFTAFFVLALAFTSIGSTPAMAANSEARIVADYEELKNYVYGKKPLYNSPSDPRVVGYVANQYVTIVQPWFVVNTSLGEKWIGYNRWALSLWKNFNPDAGTLYVDEKEPIRNDPGSQPVGYVADQYVNVKQSWYLIKTSLGEKWIGYNM